MVTTSQQNTTTHKHSSVLQPNVTVTPLLIKNDSNPSVVTVTMESVSVSGNVSTAVVNRSAGASVPRVSDSRRSNKPIMEKRRRARINNCLNELKTLILDAMKKDPARHSKLEKADILEMTVKHLRNLQRQSMSNVADQSVVGKFRAGFTECATEVGRYPGLDPIVKKKLLQHLATCLNQTNKVPEQPQVQVHIFPNPLRSTEQQVPQSGIILSNGNGAGVPVLPTRLPNGDLALILPATAQARQQPSPVPQLVPLVQERSASIVSGGSGSSYSPIHSPEPMDTMYCTQQKPLSLVVRKNSPVEENPEGKPWRPWQGLAQ